MQTSLFVTFRFCCEMLYSNKCNGEAYQQAITIELSIRQVDTMNDTPIIREEIGRVDNFKNLFTLPSKIFHYYTLLIHLTFLIDTCYL